MDKLKLEFLMKKHGYDRDDIMKLQDWSSTTYYRKMSGSSDWTVEEVNNLLKLKFELVDVIDIFFTEAMS